MKKNDSIILSGEEIIILAGLLKYNHILAVDDSVFYSFCTEETNKVRKVVEKFETQGSIYYDFSGELKISEELKTIIETICNPRIVIVLSGNFYSKKKNTEYVAIKDRAIRFQSKVSDIYEFEIFSKEEVLNVFMKIKDSKSTSSTKVIGKENSFCEKLTAEDAKKMRERIVSFQESEVLECLKKQIKEEKAIKPIMRFLSGNCKYHRIQVFDKSEKEYKCEYDVLLTQDKELFMKISKDTNEILSFSSVQPKSIYGEIAGWIK